MNRNGVALDVGRENFEAVVLQGSAVTPVLVDFWAPWCAPCRSLGPLLDKLAAEMDGRFVLAKVDTDAEPEIAGEYGIRGIPDVKLFIDGKVVDQFTGALPERELRAFLERALPSPAAPLVAQARTLREAADPGAALTVLAEALALDPADEAAALERVAALLALGRVDEAASGIAALDSPPRRLPVRDQARRAALAAQVALRAHGHDDIDALAAAAARTPVDCAAMLAYADALAARGDYEPALAAFLAIVATDRSFDDDVGRRRMLTIFAALGGDDERVRRYRRELAAAINR